MTFDTTPIDLYLEIGPLKERDYTGVAHVTSALAEQMMAPRPGLRANFFYGHSMIDRQVVENLLESRDGTLLDWHVSSRHGRPAPMRFDCPSVGIFPNRKTCRRAFDFEVQIIHDLSTLLTPQYHHEHTIAFHALSMEHDLASNDLTACVSDATREDVLAYFPFVDPATAITIYNAASPPKDFEHYVPTDKKYILVLGTIEPRKNVDVVLEFVKNNPGFATMFRFVFLGRYGWGATIDKLISEFGLRDVYERGDIVFPGFLSDSRKNTLLRDAHLLIYPSLFEGYGLPIVEAMSLGTPSMTTSSSSLPEVGGEACFYFDPFEANDFRRVLIESLLKIETDGVLLRERCKAQASKFAWDTSYARLIQAIRACSTAGVS